MRGLVGVAHVDPLGIEQLPIAYVAECSALARVPKQHRDNVSDLFPARLDILCNWLPFPYHLFLYDREPCAWRSDWIAESVYRTSRPGRQPEPAVCWIAESCQP